MIKTVVAFRELFYFIDFKKMIDRSAFVRMNEKFMLQIIMYFSNESFEPLHEKTNILVSDLVLHKPGCTATEDG